MLAPLYCKKIIQTLYPLLELLLGIAYVCYSQNTALKTKQYLAL